MGAPLKNKLLDVSRVYLEVMAYYLARYMYIWNDSLIEYPKSRCNWMLSQVQ